MRLPWFMKSYALHVIILFVTMTAAPAREVPRDVVLGTLGERMNTYMERLTALGFSGSVLVAQHDRVILHHAYGVADPRTGRRNTVATLFSTGSVTKQFTAAAIMKLEAEGKLSVTDPLSKFIDGVPDDKRAITLHHLLTHTAGLAPSYGDDDESVARDDLVARILHAPLELPVGEEYQYSNAGFTLLAVVIENVTGEPYEEYLRTSLYLPNGMEHTGLTSLAVDDDAVAHARNEHSGYRSAADHPADAWNLYGNGGQLSTTGDMYRWYLALEHDHVMPAESKARMFARHVREGGNSYYGYGWAIVESRRGGDVVWHNGGSDGLWSCAVYQYKDDDAVFIVFANATLDGRHPVDGIAVNLSRLLFGEDAVMPPDVASLPVLDGTALDGVYDLGTGESVTVRCDGATVVVTPRGPRTMSALFPAPFDDGVDYSAMTARMLDAMRAGDFEGAGRDVRMAQPDRSAADWLRGWWESLDGIERIGSVEMTGTRFGPPFQTYFTLVLPDGPRDFCFYWEDGRCVGIAPESPPALTLYPTAGTDGTRFVQFGLYTSDPVHADISGDGAIAIGTQADSLVGARRAGTR